MDVLIWLCSWDSLRSNMQNPQILEIPSRWIYARGLMYEREGLSPRRAAEEAVEDWNAKQFVGRIERAERRVGGVQC